MKQADFFKLSLEQNHQSQKTLEKRGGQRRGAGRKRQVDEGAHALRPFIDGKKHPLHVTIRLRDGLPGLRREKTLRRLKSFMREARKFGLRVNHFSLLSNHLHMIAEVDSTEALKRGMMSFNGRLGRWLRKQGVKAENYPRGFFKGRYHVQIIKTCRQMRNVLKYVLLNAAKHFRKCAYIDEFSSGASFQKWPELLKERFYGLIQAQVMSLQEEFAQDKFAQDEFAADENRRANTAGGTGKNISVDIEGLTEPLTWLLKTGWQRG